MHNSDLVQPLLPLLLGQLRLLFDSLIGLVPSAPGECLRLMTRILRLNPRERPSAVECLRMEFFTRGVPTIVTDYTPRSAEQVREEAKLRRKTAERAGRKARRGGGAQEGTDWQIIFDDSMDVEPYL